MNGTITRFFLSSSGNVSARLTGNGRCAGGAKQALLLILILSISLASSLPAQSQESGGLWQTYMDAARKAREGKNYEESEKLYQMAEVKAKDFGETDERYARTQVFIVANFLDQKKYAEAEPHYRLLLVSLEKVSAADSTGFASLVYSLAQIYYGIKHYREAEPLYKYALDIYKRGMKPGDTLVATQYLHFLGNNYFAEGKQKEAEEAFKGELAILEPDPVLSKDLNFAYTLGYLALIAQNFQKDNEAEKYLKRAYEVVKNLRGENHPDTSSMLKALAIVLARQEPRYADAVTTMQRAMQIDEAVFGTPSREVANDLDFMASVYKQQGNFDESTSFLTRALDMLEHVATTEAAQFSSVAFNLADSYTLKRNYVEGEAVCKRLGALFEKKALKNQESDLFVNDCLEIVYYQEGDYVAEAATAKKSIAIEEKLGAEKETALADELTALAGSYLRQMKYEDALATLQRAEKIYSKDSSTPQPELLYSLARYYYFTGKYAESESYFVKAIALAEPRKDTVNEYNTAWFKKGYALLLFAQGKSALGEEMFRKAVDQLRTSKRLRREADISTSWHELAMLFATKGKYTEAASLFKQAIELREKVLGPDHPNLAASLEGYAAVLIKLGRAGEATPLEQRAQTIRAKQNPR